MQKLNEEEINNLLTENDLNEWQIIKDPETGSLKIGTAYEMENFLDGIDFVNAIAALSEEHNHHPELFINFSTVEIILWTHDSDGVTEKDIRLAGEIEQL